MKGFYFALFISLATISFVSAQKGTIRGTILDKLTKETIIKYLKHLDPIEKQAYTIGINHLGSSFNVVKSNGYIEWIKNNK